MLHQEELRRVFDTFQALFASVHSLVDKRDFYDTYRPILGEPVDPTYGRSHLRPSHFAQGVAASVTMAACSGILAQRHRARRYLPPDSHKGKRDTHARTGARAHDADDEERKQTNTPK